MQKLTFAGIALMLCLSTSATAQDSFSERARRYVETYKEMAVAEQKRSGIPAAITLGQGIYETSAGASELATEANNHFGIKCKKDWAGETFAHTDDAPNECFRKYKSAGESYRDHSDYLKNSPRYKSCFAQSATDYASWARELKKCGYATNPQYAQRLIKIIEDYRLQEFTYLAMKDNAPGDAPAEVVPEEDAPRKEVAAARYEYKSEETVNNFAAAVAPAETGDTGVQQTATADDAHHRNGLKGFYAHKGDVLLEQAMKNNIRYAKLLELNDLPDAPLAEDMFVYLERKHSKGSHETYQVRAGERLQGIAQKEGIQLRQLRTYNQLDIGEEPAPGAVLQLQRYASSRPNLVKTATNASSVAAAAGTTQNNGEYIATGNSRPETAPITRPAVMQQEPAAEKEELKESVKAESSVRDEPVPVVPVIKKEQPVKNAAPSAPAINIADEAAVEEQPAAKEELEEPQDELSRLKARLDKAVYGQGSPRKDNVAPAPVTPVQSQPAPTTPAASAKGIRYYTVQKGDTAFSIAKKHNISMRELMEWNQLNFDAIKVGQKLKVSQ